MDPKERVRLQEFLRTRFALKGLTVRARANVKDSAEVYLGDEFIATLTKDTEDGDLCYHFTMTILDVDLEGN